MQKTEAQRREEINSLFSVKEIGEINSIDRLAQQGSDRIYYRVSTDEKTFIVTNGTNTKENETFIYFSKHFYQKNLPVPEIFAVSEDKNWYVQEDFGDTSLLAVLQEKGYTDEVFQLYVKSLQSLAALQIDGDKDLDYDKTLTSRSFGKEAIMADLLYFKYYFLDVLQRPYDKQALLQDFDALSNHLSEAKYSCFMYRDFQSRNIMVTADEKIHFIDYQGGMKGAPQYDVAALLWQAKADLPNEWKEKLWKEYQQAFEAKLGEVTDADSFRNRYRGYVLIRLLQVMGAYGFRGLFERKAHFLTSIPLGLQNLKTFITDWKQIESFPELKKILLLITADDVIAEFTATKANEETSLKVRINSFSFIQNGYPPDPTVNGGGYVFDCRGILNPGRIEQYKTLSGEDESVQQYLEQETKMNAFLNNVFSIVDISIEDYMNRNFESLMVNFGCTGGQHRSVYAANALARHLRNKYGVSVEVEHMNRSGWRE